MFDCLEGNIYCSSAGLTVDIKQNRHCGTLRRCDQCLAELFVGVTLLILNQS